MIDIEAFSYDGNGNRLFSLPGWLDTSTYVPGTNLLDHVSGSVAKYFSYDSSGNVISDQSKGATFNYNRLNLMDTVSFSGQNYLAMGYGPGGDRIFKDYDLSVTGPCVSFL